MIKISTHKVEVEENKLESVICDMCETEITDEMELQEFYYVRFTGGYNSIFGDEAEVKFDLCQHCLMRLVKDNNIKVRYE